MKDVYSRTSVWHTIRFRNTTIRAVYTLKQIVETVQWNYYILQIVFMSERVER